MMFFNILPPTAAHCLSLFLRHLVKLDDRFSQGLGVPRRDGEATMSLFDWIVERITGQDNWLSRRQVIEELV